MFDEWCAVCEEPLNNEFQCLYSYGNLYEYCYGNLYEGSVICQDCAYDDGEGFNEGSYQVVCQQQV